MGGILKHSAKGYSGTLKIFDAGGITLRSIDYAEPRPFADLLGDMTVDALTILDQKPSPALAAFLHTPVCAHPESISALGKAAFLPQFSPELFAAYDRILKDDPTFAAVRHWYANQKYWKDGDAAARDLQTAIAISDRPNPAYFIDLLINNIADKKLAAHFPEWLDRAQKVIGVDSPDLLAGRWMNKAAPDVNDGPAFQHALEVAGRYPNNSSLLYALARVSSTPNSRFLDFDLAVALHGCMLYNRYMPGTDDRAQECAAISAELGALGRWQDAASFAALGLQIDPGADRAIQAMIDADSSLGRFHDALALAEKSAGHLTPEAIERAAVDYALSGDPQGLEHFFSKNALALKQRHADLIVDTYLALLRNQPINPSGTAAMLFMARAPSDELFPLLVQIDLLHGTAHFQGMIAESLGMFPGNRQLWFLFDKCTQRPPGFNAADVYFSLAHLHPEDDWCVQAQKRSAHLGGALTSPAAVQQLLADFPADHPQTPDAARQKRNHTLFYTGLAPFTAASAFFQLLDAGQTARAHDVASRYHTFALEVGQPAGIIFAQHLVRIAAPEPATAPRSDE